MSPVIGLAGIAASFYFIFTAPSPGFQGYFDLPSLVLLGVAPPCIMLLSHTIKDFYVGSGTLLRALFQTQTRVEAEIINVLTHSSAMVRSEGIGALVRVRDAVRYELLRDGISLIVNDFSPEEIRHNLTAKINAKQTRMALAGNLFENMAKICPGVGMIGTLLGLIAMLSNLTDPSKIGGGMALAMITTLYGLMLGTLLYAPCSEKISLESEKTQELDFMVLEGVLSLKGKKSSVHLNDIMKTYANRRSGNQPNQAQQRRGA